MLSVIDVSVGSVMCSYVAEVCFTICFDFHLCLNLWVSCNKLSPVLLGHSSLAVLAYDFIDLLV